MCNGTLVIYMHFQLSLLQINRTMGQYTNKLLLVALLLVCEKVVSATKSAESGHKPVLACYYGTWAKWHGLLANQIPAHLCTHVIAAFADVTVTPPGIQLHDRGDDNTTIPALKALRLNNTDLKLLVSVGGWNHGIARFTHIASDPNKLVLFAQNVIKFLRARDLDGVDIAWEFPFNATMYTSFIEALRAEITSDRQVTNSSPLILTAAVSAEIHNIKLGYDIPALSRLLDLVMLMTFDYHGLWEGRTGHNGPLYARDDEKGWRADQNVNSSVKYWLDAGMPSHKIVVGVAAFGRYFRLVDAGSGNTVGSTAEWWTWPLSDPYHYICRSSQQRAMISHWDEQARVPYATDGRTWLSYDNLTSVSLKAQYAVNTGVRGVFVWSLDQDDYSGHCGQGIFPLTTAIRQIFISGRVRPISSIIHIPTPLLPQIATSILEENEPSKSDKSTSLSIQSNRGTTQLTASISLPLEHIFTPTPILSTHNSAISEYTSRTVGIIDNFHSTQTLLVDGNKARTSHLVYTNNRHNFSYTPDTGNLIPYTMKPDITQNSLIHIQTKTSSFAPFGGSKVRAEIQSVASPIMSSINVSVVTSTVHPTPDTRENATSVWSMLTWKCYGVDTTIPTCGLGDTYLIVPCQCKLFVHCDHGYSHVKVCPSSLVFDLNQSQCNYYWMAGRRDCHERNRL